MLCKAKKNYKGNRKINDDDNLGSWTRKEHLNYNLLINMVNN